MAKRRSLDLPSVPWPLVPRAQLATDPNAPSATTASGRNPWPQLWAEALAEGHDMAGVCREAAHQWRAGQAHQEEIW